MPETDMIRGVEQFLYREARLLDERRFHEWLRLFTDDVHYRMAARSNRYPRSSKAIVMLDAERYVEENLAWAEDPPSRTRHLITNVEVVPDASDSEAGVHCNFVVYRSRGETEQDFYVGTREDKLRRVDGEWRIANRRMILDQNVLSAKNLSIFF